MKKIEIAKAKLNYLLVDCFHLVEKHEDLWLRTQPDENVSVTEVHTLVAIKNAGLLNKTKDIARDLGITLGSLVVATKTLEKKNYLKRKSDEKDGRVVRLFLTDRGENICKRHKLFHDEMMNSVLVDCSKKEIEVLLSALEKVTFFLLEQVQKI